MTDASRFSLRPTVEADWREVRALRLEMLLDTPTAFGESFVSAVDHDEAEWRMRARRGTETPGSTSLVAITPAGRWIGSMGGYLDGTSPLLVGVYVHPDFRGRAWGVTDALLAGVIRWASRHGDVLRLSVHQDNGRAIAAYIARDFVPTGRTHPYSLDPNRTEIEMERRISAARAG
ncbi:MAG: hypothetical protein RI885_2529 [Actinomycetota bacterium]